MGCRASIAACRNVAREIPVVLEETVRGERNESKCV